MSARLIAAVNFSRGRSAAALGLIILLASIANRGVAEVTLEHYRGFTNGQWGQVHYRVWGSAGEPTVLLLHKMVWSSVEFEKVQPVLARLHVRSIAIDLPGYGLSDPPDRQPSAGDYVKDLAVILDKLGIRRISIVGVDTGATLAVAFERLYPERVIRLVLDGPPIVDAQTLATYQAEPEFDRSPEPEGAEFSRRAQAMQSQGPMSPEAIHLSILQFFIASPHYLYGHHAIFAYDLDAALRKVSAPTLLLNSGTGWRFQRALAARGFRPDFHYQDLHWSGSQVAYDAPGPWATAVAQFIGSPAHTL